MILRCPTPILNVEPYLVVGILPESDRPAPLRFDPAIAIRQE
ncbi:MAG: hypothetical protein NTV52_32940 [Acidobacteria bacterium]|nr:hypothetical protein [Acidobacteriota bacterium]